ncbi:MAG: DUF4412 domain-containing protein [Calditrichaeota bacterium]|nr:DUF4412 domain-containing protein [Calditrichota bacterium]
MAFLNFFSKKDPRKNALREKCSLWGISLIVCQIVLRCFSPALAQDFEGVIEYKRSITLAGEAALPAGKILCYFKDNMMRQENLKDRTVTIVDVSRQLITISNNESGTYVEYDLSRIPQATNDEYQLKVSGNRKIINGYSCDQLLIVKADGQEIVTEIWITRDWGRYENIGKIYALFLLVSDFGPLAGVEVWSRQLNEDDLTIDQLVKVTSTPVSASKFSFPASYINVTQSQARRGGNVGVSAETYPRQQRQVFINGKRLQAATLQALERLYGVRVRDGHYWYDRTAGLWGLEGGPAAGRMQPGHDLGGPLPPDASRSHTGVFINGRQIHILELQALSQMFGWVRPGRYWLNAQGIGGHEGGPAQFNLMQQGTGSKESLLSGYFLTGVKVFGW